MLVLQCKKSVLNRQFKIFHRSTDFKANPYFLSFTLEEDGSHYASEVSSSIVHRGGKMGSCYDVNVGVEKEAHTSGELWLNEYSGALLMVVIWLTTRVNENCKTEINMETIYGRALCNDVYLAFCYLNKK